jgi:hypothetical protein
MKFKFQTLFILAAVLVLLIASCNQTTTPTVVRPNAPDSLRATSLDSTTVRIKWVLSTSESDLGFTGYTLVITGGGPIAPISISKGTNTYTETGLSAGTIYTFSLYANMDTVESATAATVQWSPAMRFDINVNGDVIKVYETASSFGSGLDLYDPTSTPSAPRVWTVANGDQWNLALDTRTTGQTIVASPTLVNYNYGTQPTVTEISADGFLDVTSLDNVFDSQALSAGNFAERSFVLEDLGIASNTGVVLILRTKEGSNTLYTYAKLLIKKTGDTWLQGTAPNRYIECVVSYQRTPGVPYAY